MSNVTRRDSPEGTSPTFTPLAFTPAGPGNRVSSRLSPKADGRQSGSSKDEIWADDDDVSIRRMNPEQWQQVPDGIGRAVRSGVTTRVPANALQRRIRNASRSIQRPGPGRFRRRSRNRSWLSRERGTSLPDARDGPGPASGNSLADPRVLARRRMRSG